MSDRPLPCSGLHAGKRCYVAPKSTAPARHAPATLSRLPLPAMPPHCTKDPRARRAHSFPARDNSECTAPPLRTRQEFPAATVTGAKIARRSADPSFLPRESRPWFPPTTPIQRPPAQGKSTRSTEIPAARYTAESLFPPAIQLLAFFTYLLGQFVQQGLVMLSNGFDQAGNQQIRARARTG